MMRLSFGYKLYASVIAIFLIFASAFILFQQKREKEYKVQQLNATLQTYNICLGGELENHGLYGEKAWTDYVKKHRIPGLRLTLINEQGVVIFDNLMKNYRAMANPAARKEVADALRQGTGYDLERNSQTLNRNYFYSATYIPAAKMVVRTALPYNHSLTRTLEADLHFLWFTLTALLVLVLVLYRFVGRLSANITKLQLFATRADHNESLDTEDLIDFPNDELGEIAERIIKLYKRLQSTREEQNKLKRQLTQNIAHELKTPVASIQGYLETILDNPHITPDMCDRFLQRCHEQSRRLTALLHDISALNRMDDASTLLDFETVDVAHLVQSIQEATALQMQERHIVFNNLLPATLTVKGNQALLYSVFRNLVDNAIAYAGEGVTITLSAEETETHWNFTFADNGVGVPAEHLPRLFERFYRVDKGRSRAMGGTGLGLSIVKNALRLHGNAPITVKNREGGGLQFTFSLPE